MPPTNTLLLDLTPRQVLALTGDQLPDGYRRALGRYRYGPGAFKIDWAMDGPIPWRAAACHRAATVHLGVHWPKWPQLNGSLGEVNIPTSRMCYCRSRVCAALRDNH